MYKHVQHDLEILKDSSVLQTDLNKFIRKEISEYSGDFRKYKNGKDPLIDKSLGLQKIFSELVSACILSGLSDVKMIIILMKLYVELSMIFNNPKQYLKGDDKIKLPMLDMLENNMQKENNGMFEKSSNTLGSSLEFLITLLYRVMTKKNITHSSQFPNIELFRIYLLSFYLNDCYLYSIKDEEVETFEKRWQVNLSLLDSSTEVERNQWWELAGYFYGLHKDIGNSCVQLDSIKVRNSIIETNWLKTFGNCEIEVQDLVYRKKLVEMQIAIKYQEPSLQLDQTLEKAKEELLAEQKILESLKFNSSWANAIDLDSIFAPSAMNDPLIQQYREEAEYYFRIAAKLLHPDRRSQLLKGTELTKEQDDELNKLYRELMTLRESHSLNPLDMLVGDYFSVNKIKRIVAQAEIIFRMLGIKLPKLKLLVIGETMDEQLKFLMNEYNLLQTELAQIQASIQLLFSDKEIYQKSCILNNPESIETVTKKFEDVIESNTRELENLNKELTELFEGK
jgi:hypothetical protein